MGERQFGPYRLVQQIAVGGMAEIHLAKTSGVAGFEKYVALKMIHPNFSQDEQFVQMLIDEAKITVQLQHANIAQTFDLGRVGDTFYLTMEYVDGVDLFSLLREGAERDLTMPLDIAAHVCRCVANGLDYAHRKRDVNGRPLGIVHRDVSPQNVLLSRSGEIKLVDFGIAKASHRARQTEAGVIKGKYYYMSPEQALAEKVDHRSDIFSAGILLHEMLTGQMLYMEDDLHELLVRVRQADIPSPSEIRKDLPPQLERIVMRALAKRPEDRFQSAGELATELGKFLHVHSPVFTAAKVSSYIREVFPDASAAAASAPAAKAELPERRSNRVTKEQLLREPSEFYDENSVIFRFEDLAGAPGRNRLGPASKPPPTQPATKDHKPAKPFARGADMSTKLIDPTALPGLGDDDEHTVISGPPQFSQDEQPSRPAPGLPKPPPPAPKPSPSSERAPSRSGLPLAAPLQTGAHTAEPDKPAAPEPPRPGTDGQSEANTSGPGGAGTPPAVLGSPGTPQPQTPYPAPGQSGHLPAQPHAAPSGPGFSVPPIPSLGPDRLRSPFVIACLAILALAVIGAAFGAIFLDDDESSSQEMEIILER